MNRKNMLYAVGMAVFFIGGCGKAEKQLEYIGAANAKNLALEAAGIAASQAEFTSVDLSRQNGQDYYVVEFSASGADYAYDIDALTGVIIDAEIPASNEPQKKMETVDSTDQPSGMITDEEAKARALAHAGLTKEQVTFLTCVPDYEDGRSIFETEFYTADGREYDYEIDAVTGEIVSFDHDAEAAATPDTGNTGKITEQEAMKLALAQVPGASKSDIREFETDRDDGRTEYEGKIIYEGMEYEFEIDAYSGAIRSWEAEPMNDHLH